MVTSNSVSLCPWKHLLTLAALSFTCVAFPAAYAAGGKAFHIVIHRTSDDEGTLTFSRDGKDIFTTKCWWNPKVRIPKGKYTGCSTTQMATKKSKAVYLPDEQTGKKGIFIHQGEGPQHSDGCIVIAKDRIAEIYDTVPRDGKQIIVQVNDD